MFNKKSDQKNAYMLKGGLRRLGYDWWWHSFTAIHEKTGKQKAFFIEYFVCNPASGGHQPILGQERVNKNNMVKPSYLMVKAGCWGEDHIQLNRFFGWDHVKMKKKRPFALSAGNCYLDDKRLMGSVSVSEKNSELHPELMCDSGSIEWNLHADKKIAYNVGYGTSAPFRLLECFQMYWHVQGMKTLYRGTITLNGEVYRVIPEKSYGYADKNWGRDFTSPWLWLSSNCMRSRKTGKVLKNSAFDIGGGKPKIYFLPLDRKLLGAFYYEGKEYEYNFSKFWTGVKTTFKSWETETEVRWYVRQENNTSVMETQVKCNKKDMILINYEAPNGKRLHNRLWNGGNGVGRIKLYKKNKDKLVLIDDIDVTHIGCEYGEYCEA